MSDRTCIRIMACLIAIMLVSGGAFAVILRKAATSYSNSSVNPIVGRSRITTSTPIKACQFSPSPAITIGTTVSTYSLPISAARSIGTLEAGGASSGEAISRCS
jgi:hypothetical protein